MLNTVSIKNFWEHLEKKSSPPKYVTKINIVQFNDLKKKADNKEEFYIKNIIKKMYKGEAFIVRNAAKKNLKEITVKLAKYYDKKERPSFHKMLDGTPNFHIIKNHKVAKKYSLYAIRHSYFLYNWNIKTKLQKQFKDSVYKHWRYVKFLAGNGKYQYEKNIPSQIDYVILK